MISVAEQAILQMLVFKLAVLQDVEPGFMKDVVFEKFQGEE